MKQGIHRVKADKMGYLLANVLKDYQMRAASD